MSISDQTIRPAVNPGSPPISPAQLATGNTGALPAPPVSNATRHLCAGAYLDEDFRRASLNEVYHQSRRIVAPSYGFDLITVLGHCLRARNLALVRDGLLVGVVLVMSCFAPVAVAETAVLLIELQLIIMIWRLLRDAVRLLHAGQPTAIQTRVWVRGVWIVGGIFALFFIYVWLGFLYLARFLASLDPNSSHGSAGLDAFTASPQLTWGAAIVLMFVVFGVPVGVNIWRQRQLDGLVPGKRPAPPAPAPRFAEIDRQQHGNTVVYSDYSPFVGSGRVLAHWSFAQLLVRRADPAQSLRGEPVAEFDTPPFTANEVIEQLNLQLRQLGHEPDSKRLLPGLTVDDRIFLAGTEVSYLTPVTPPEYVAQVIGYPTAPARHYLVCQVVSWRGELVTTVHVHAAVQGRALYLELCTTALPPCDERYRIVDQVGGTDRSRTCAGSSGGS